MQDNAIISVIDTKKNKLKRNIIAELYRAQSRTIAQLASTVHSSVPSTTALIEELSATDWVHGIGIGTAQFGRKPSLFALNPNRYVSLVVDSNVHDTKLLIFNLNNEVIHRVDLDLQLGETHQFVEKLHDPLNQLAQYLRVEGREVIGIGATMPGLVNPVLSLNHTYPELSQPGHSLSTLFALLFEAPVYYINDTKATILGEYHFGLAQGKKHVLSINIDWGIGLGVIINGEVLQGTAGFAGELGHIQMKTDGELCFCGKVGCLETLASASSLIRRAKAGLRQGRMSLLNEEGPEAITIEMIIAKANVGDGFCIDLLSEVGSELGRGLATAVHLFNPELIIVNGVLARVAKSIRRPLEQALDKYCLLNYRDNLKIELSELGEMAKLYGTQAYVLQNLLEYEQIP